MTQHRDIVAERSLAWTPQMWLMTPLRLRYCLPLWRCLPLLWLMTPLRLRYCLTLSQMMHSPLRC
tara:strand:+ start:498 stop:692 length:195 start_codon:yes stop_codon:yes gene_type:complete